MQANSSGGVGASSDEVQKTMRRGIKRVKATYRSVVYFCLTGSIFTFVAMFLFKLRILLDVIAAGTFIPLMTLAQLTVFASRLIFKKKKNVRVGSLVGGPNDSKKKINFVSTRNSVSSSAGE